MEDVEPMRKYLQASTLSGGMLIALLLSIGFVLAFSLSMPRPAAVSSDLRLADAVAQQDKDATRALLRRRADVNTPQADGATALHWLRPRARLR